MFMVVAKLGLPVHALETIIILVECSYGAFVALVTSHHDDYVVERRVMAYPEARQRSFNTTEDR